MPLRNGAGYVGLFCAEMPEARFFDVYHVVNSNEDPHVVCRLDQRFLDVCVPGSIVPIAVAPDKPCQVGVRVDKGRVWIDLGDCPGGVPTRLTVTVSGVRRGRRGNRFPAFNAAAAQRNQAFWEQAYEP
jgi:hypothetical protein